MSRIFFRKSFACLPNVMRWEIIDIRFNTSIVNRNFFVMIFVQSSTSMNAGQNYFQRDRTGRCSPAPIRVYGGMLIGKCPEIADVPSNALAAACCETGKPPHATR